MIWGKSLYLSEQTLPPSVNLQLVAPVLWGCSADLCEPQFPSLQVGLWEAEMRRCLCSRHLAPGPWYSFPHFHSSLLPGNPASSPHSACLRVLLPLWGGLTRPRSQAHETHNISIKQDVQGLSLYIALLRHQLVRAGSGCRVLGAPAQIPRDSLAG